MDKVTQTIEIKGKILLFGGVYSNLQALKKLRKIADTLKIPPKNCICTGDIVGYCAQPEETVQFLKKWGAKSILGNVEEQLINDADTCGCNFDEGSRCDVLSNQWFPYAKQMISEKSIQFLKTLPRYFRFHYAGKTVQVVHGTYSNISEFVFKSTPWEVKQAEFHKTESEVIIAGHCGLPFYHQADNYLWLNPGVIGMPANNGSPKVWYVIMEDADNLLSFQHHSFSYNHLKTFRFMLKNKLPKAYADTLLTGIWDNMEILPPAEREAKGKIITEVML